ncbi:MAG: AMP-binding protein, partial [Flavobacteriales bacterium]
TLPLYEKFDKDSLPPAIVIPAGKTLQLKIREVDMPWDDFLSDVSEFDSVELHAADHCNILFSSGTTGDPKAIPWTHTTPIKCAADGYLHHNIQQGDVVAWPTNIGWMMGPWLIFASLINNATIALYYGAPAGRDFGEFVQNARVNMLGLVPSMVKRWIETDCMKGLDWSSIKVYSSTGESSNPQDYLWLMCRAGWKPVIEYCGGTEIGGGYFTGTVVQPASPSAFSTTALGLDVLIMDEEEEPGSTGELYVLPPSIGLSTSLLNKDHHEVYYANTPKPNSAVRGSMGTTLKDQFAEFGCSPALRRHGDEVQQLPNGYFKALGRVDDTMNLGGIKTSSVEIERILDLVDGVAETAAISINPRGGGPEELIVFAVLHEGHDMGPEELKSVFQASIRKNLNPLFHIRDVVVTETLPRTASNKVMRRVLRKRYTKSHPD